MEDNMLILPDGRQIAYVEYGNPNGKPIILFHGNRNSRLMYEFISDYAYKSNLYVIVPDRPGYGLSDFYSHGSSIVDYPSDVTFLADSLDIDRFAVFGYSCGGPFALACAWKIPERITAVGVFASIGPLNPESSFGIPSGLRTLYWLSGRIPWSVRISLGITSYVVKHHIDTYLKIIHSSLSKTDKEIYGRLGLREKLRADRIDGVRQGGWAAAYDLSLAAKWPIPLDQINTRVHLWQGLEDKVVGRMGNYMARYISDCEAIFMTWVGHYWIFDHLPRMLDELLEYDVKSSI